MEARSAAELHLPQCVYQLSSLHDCSVVTGKSHGCSCLFAHDDSAHSWDPDHPHPKNKKSIHVNKAILQADKK